MLRAEKNARLKQFTITFLVTALMLLPKYGLREKRYFMEYWQMSVLHTDYQEAHQESH